MYMTVYKKKCKVKFKKVYQIRELGGAPKKCLDEHSLDL